MTLVSYFVFTSFFSTINGLFLLQIRSVNLIWIKKNRICKTRKEKYLGRFTRLAYLDSNASSYPSPIRDAALVRLNHFNTDSLSCTQFEHRPAKSPTGLITIKVKTAKSVSKPDKGIELSWSRAFTAIKEVSTNRMN
ncbi:MAG: hypothetical protein ACI8XC_000890 [Gammaproteobacteria bacterium]|jgi:hypothetical protein